MARTGRSRRAHRTSNLVGLLALLATACATTTGPTAADSEPAGPPVPTHEFVTFDGERTSLPEFTGTPVVVNFWASWCGPCVAEMPDFEQVHRDLAGRVRFLGINTQDERAAAEALVERTGVTYDLALDPDGELFRAFEVFAMPSTYFVDAQGHVVHRHSGLATREQLRTLIDQHLAS